MAVRPSPNHGERPHGRRPDMLVLHYTGMPTCEAALARLTSPESGVSAHYLVTEGGEIVQLVPEYLRAWHAGAGAWAGDPDLNSCSIGIEIANAGHDGGLPPFPPAQTAAVIRLSRDIVARHRIAPARVLGHSDTAPQRKQDPGERFPWRELHAAGVGHWVEPAPLNGPGGLGPGDRGEPVFRLQEALDRYGYAVPITGAYDLPTYQVVTAFQRHFRPARVDGLADTSTLETLRRLLGTDG